MHIKKTKTSVDAIHWNGQNHRAMFIFLGGKENENIKCLGDNFYIDHSRVDGGLIIKTLDGEQPAIIGDYIIKTNNGNYYPCSADIFELKYDHETK